VGTDYRLRCPEIAGRAEGDLRAAAEGAAAVLAGGPARFESEYRIVDSAGVARWFHTKVSRLENTPLARFVVDHFEVTERRRAEQERAARIEAEAVNRAKDRFLAAVSHDLRSPLNAIVGYVQLLRTGALDADETRHALEVIDRNVRAQTQLIDDLLDVSRAITGKLHLEIAEVRPDELVRGAVDTVAPGPPATATCGWSPRWRSRPPSSKATPGGCSRCSTTCWATR
jgi:signal transduction histidine kinase